MYNLLLLIIITFDQKHKFINCRVVELRIVGSLQYHGKKGKENRNVREWKGEKNCEK